MSLHALQPRNLLGRNQATRTLTRGPPRAQLRTRSRIQMGRF